MKMLNMLCNSGLLYWRLKIAQSFFLSEFRLWSTPVHSNNRV